MPGKRFQFELNFICVTVFVFTRSAEWTGVRCRVWIFPVCVHCACVKPFVLTNYGLIYKNVLSHHVTYRLNEDMLKTYKQGIHFYIFVSENGSSLEERIYATAKKRRIKTVCSEKVSKVQSFIQAFLGSKCIRQVFQNFLSSFSHRSNHQQCTGFVLDWPYCILSLIMLKLIIVYQLIVKISKTLESHLDNSVLELALWFLTRAIIDFLHNALKNCAFTGFRQLKDLTVKEHVKIRFTTKKCSYVMIEMHSLPMMDRDYFRKSWKMYNYVLPRNNCFHFKYEQHLEATSIPIMCHQHSASAFDLSLWQRIERVLPITRFFPDAISNPEQDMAFLGYRLATLSALPSSVPVSRVRLADAGFYFRGHADEVFCYRCHRNYSGWRAGDNPFVIHHRISPSCPHVVEMDRETPSLAPREPLSSSINTLTRPNELEPTGMEERRPQGQRAQQTDARRSQTSTSSFVEDSERGVTFNGEGGAADARAAGGGPRLMFPRPGLDLGGAVYPMYQDMASRRRSYLAWDETRAPPLDQMILCGMYFAGYGDCVRCFYCGVGLKSWEVTDDVWTEHVRWRPDCGYLRAVKGDNFIQKILDQSQELEVMGLNPAHQARNGRMADGGSRPGAIDGPSSLCAALQSEIDTTTPSSPITPVSATSPEPPTSPTTLSTAQLTQPASRASDVSTSASVVTSHLVTAKFSSEFPATLTPLPSSLADDRSTGRVQAFRGDGATGIAGHSDLSTDTVDGKSEWYRGCHGENQELSRRAECQICHRNTTNTIFLPCGHLVSCETCARTVTSCIVCNEPIDGTTRVQMG